ncbi:Flotillin-like protein 2 [Acorus calamus]|uniref:Flotillin-like n=1 Tax=Acorus calamus TaxID=4465 RepID=A0AAV9D651_ACOCL|nr:Flotillin-like protein 2 [Acorus calamus]
MAWYCVAGPSEYLAVTGPFINGTKFIKKGWVFIGQHCVPVDLTPQIIDIEIQAVSEEKLYFSLPMVFTIGPENDSDSLMKFAELMSAYDISSEEFRNFIRGVLEGQARALAASMKMDDIVSGINVFHSHVESFILPELKKYGLFAYTCNVKQLIDPRDGELLLAHKSRMDFVKLKSELEIEQERKVRETEFQIYQTLGTVAASFFTRQKESDGELYAKDNEARGLKTLAEGHGTFIRVLPNELGNTYAFLSDYLMRINPKTVSENGARDAVAENGAYLMRINPITVAETGARTVVVENGARATIAEAGEGSVAITPEDGGA